MLRDFTWTEKYEEAMSDEHPHYKRLVLSRQSIKITFMHYRNYITWTIIKLPVVFEEFDMVYDFWLLFSFHYHCQLVKGQL